MIILLFHLNSKELWEKKIKDIDNVFLFNIVMDNKLYFLNITTVYKQNTIVIFIEIPNHGSSM